MNSVTVHNYTASGQCLSGNDAGMRTKFQCREEGGSMDWESHGLSGATHEIEWALRIRAQVNEEFNRVVRVLERTAIKRSGQQRADTYVMIAIVEEKRAEVMSN